MRRLISTLLSLVLALSLMAPIAVRAESEATAATEYVHILYRDKTGDLKILWKLEVLRDQGTDIPADLMPGYDPAGKIGEIEDVRDITGIIVIKYRPDRDSDKAPSDVKAFMASLTKVDTFQTGNPFSNVWTFDDPSGEFSWGGSLTILADNRVAVEKITIKNAPATLKTGKSVTLKAAVKPSNATKKTVKWSISNKKYATITKNGKLTALKAGKGKTIKVTATATDGSGCKKTVKIKIK